MKLLLALILPVCFLWARPNDSVATCQKKFTVGVNNFAPFAFRVNGKLQGLAHDVLSELSERTGCQFVMNEVSRPASVEDLKRGRLDMVALMVKSDDYLPYSEFLPLYKTTRMLAVLKANWVANKKIEDYISDSKIKFANVIGPKTVMSAGEEKKLVSAGRMVATPDPEGAMHLLSQNRAQAIMMSAFLADYHIKHEGLEDKIVRIRDESMSMDVGVFASYRRMNEADRKMMAQAMESMKSDGTLLKILSRYMGSEEALKRAHD